MTKTCPLVRALYTSRNCSNSGMEKLTALELWADVRAETVLAETVLAETVLAGTLAAVERVVLAAVAMVLVGGVA